MKKTIISALLLVGLYLIIQPLLSGIIGSFIGMPKLGELLSMAFTLLLTYVRLNSAKDPEGHGICKGNYKSMPKLTAALFILPLANLPYIFFGMKITPILIAKCIFIGIMEELICRGCVYKLINDKWGENKAIIISGVIFGVMHLINLGSEPVYFTLLQVGYAAAIGITFAVVRAKTGSLLIPVIVHAIIDVLGLAAAESNIVIDSIGAVICVAFAVIYYSFYLRSNRVGLPAETATA